ncbi:hypothetical protein [Levilinea saccharolytica]|uniref:Uncharacterized protein n=1 Tax=Levilinea saccharolytica TaxID=229921 RepID=A0A0M8JPR9_9CHLR|nr:hypothetical protein [Levilinea saccharolytica]KPL80873.1 hypothetical protein ADN01_10245 [Levilinea saccharolytica]GAP19361.1 hypothetical protein LSAC_03263 [Levilinea saccharolytica]
MDVQLTRWLQKRPALRWWALIFALAIVGLGAWGCSRSKLSWMGSHHPGEASYRFEVFNGQERYRFSAAVGQMAQVDYQLHVTDGRLTLRIVDRSGTVLLEDTASAERGADSRWVGTSSDLQIYRIILEGEDAQNGSYDVQWSVD